jgi:3',5'-cyclic AMP phosphodiesterase CpdA
MLTLLQISDLHFGPLYRPEVGEALLRAAADMHVDVIVASGDFTQRAKSDQFAAARAFLDRLPAVPQIVVPGNHDIPLYRVYERLLNPYALYRQYISPELDTVLVRDDATIVALNTTAPLRKITDGQIKPWQLDFAQSAFRAAPAQAAKIVVAHHHFAPAPDSQRKRDATLGAQAALERFRRLGVELILGGHLHRSYTASSLDAFPPADNPPASDGVSASDSFAASDSATGILIVECGTSTSSRGRGRERRKNSLNVIQLDDRTTTVTHWLFSPSAGSFAPASRHVFPRRGGQFLGRPE